MSSLHHITICTGTAQGDIDFFVKVLGQRFVKRTLFYDGSIPIYHLYFADELGTPGTVMTTFPTRRTGLKGRKGSNQFTVCRSEEHTSELQSLMRISYAVFCLKKKTKPKSHSRRLLNPVQSKQQII